MSDHCDIGDTGNIIDLDGRPIDERNPPPGGADARSGREIKLIPFRRDDAVPFHCRREAARNQ
jgi:hypothetical protein